MTLPTEVGPGAVEPVSAGDRCPSCHAPVAGSWLACSQCGARLAVAAELPPGSRLFHDRFTVGRVLGRGGFGITYETEDMRLHRKVAVKELFPDAAVRHGSMVLTPPETREPFAQTRERFLGEARVLARFNHPGIVRVYEVFEEHGTAYLVLELLEGRTLAEMLRERGRPFAEPAALDVAQRVGGALSAIHAAGLLHRDVSPSNLVVTGTTRIVLIDFGLARSFDADHTAAMTRIVTPGYAPPEQYLASARFGPPTDVYGLAATLYRLLTALSLPSAIDRQNGVTMAPVASVNPSVSKLVSDAILDGLELNPDHRPQSIDAFLARLGLDPRPEAAGPPMTTPAPLAAVHPAGTSPMGSVEEHRRRDHMSDLAPIGPGPAPSASAALTVLPTERPPTIAPGSYLVPAPVLAPPGPAGPPAAPVAFVPPAFVPPAFVPPAFVPPAFVAPEPSSPLDPAAYLPAPIIGPPRRGRWLVSVPITLALVALMVADPVLIAAVIVLGVLPLLATSGDLALHRHRRTWGGATSWFQRRSELVAAGPRLVRNVAVSVIRSLPTLVLLSVLYVGWAALNHAADMGQAAPWFLRGTGVAVGLLLVLPALRGSARFASGVAVDSVHLRIAPAGLRLAQSGWLLWAVCLAVAAVGCSFTPEVWPLR